MEAALRGEEWATEHMSDIDAVGADFIRGDIAQTTTYVVFAQCQLIDWALDGRGKSTRIRKGAHNE